MDLGFIPRFLSLLLRPVHTSIRNMEKGSEEIKDKICHAFTTIKHSHEQNDIKYKYTVYQKSKAFDLFANLCDELEGWMEMNEY